MSTYFSKKQQYKIWSLHNGFTLIELLVAVTISLILISGAVGTFLNYLDKRKVSNSVDEIKTYFQRAQAEANSGDLGGCNQLSGYRVRTYLVGEITELSMQALCSVGTANAAETYEFAERVIISPTIDYNFNVLHAGVDLPGGAASEAINIANETNSFTFTIYREGRFSEGAWQ